jgi:hypothetical protein
LKTIVFTVLLTVILLKVSASSQGKYDREWCDVVGQIFHQVTSWRDQGKTVKESLEIMAKFVREHPEVNAEYPNKGFETVFGGVIFNVYSNPSYRAFGPEMNRNIVQSKCDKIGPANFITEVDTWWREYVRQSKEAR